MGSTAPVAAASATTAGVFGENTANSGTGVRGQALAGGGFGVQGTGFVGVAGNGTTGGIGMQGVAPGYVSGIGVYGVGGLIGTQGIIGSSSSAANSVGVYGQNKGTGSGASGVKGETTNGTGVAGYHNATSGAGQGVYAQTSSPGGFGVVGQSTAPAGVGLLGYCAVPASGAIAFAGSASPGNYAAYFTGTVVVSGQLVVSNPSYKSGVLKHSVDGTDRLVYCMESPESWIEDFGEGKLVNGKAEVKLDPDFAAVVQMDDYAVFLMPEGDCKGLFVTNKSAKGFSAQELQGGTSSLAFRYRVVAKPKVGAGVTLKRLEKFTMPKAPTIDPATLPEGCACRCADAARTARIVATALARTGPATIGDERVSHRCGPGRAPAAATAPPAKVDAPVPAPPSRP